MSRLTFQFVLITLILTTFCVDTKAEVFVVTSNADAGAGTLREALTRAAANGTTDKDFIHFNLPDQSEAGRTITLLSQLPDVSSNLDIDGSTQQGNVFGVSTSRVQIAMSFPFVTTYYGLTLINVSDIGIYGLYIRSFLPFNTSGNRFQWQGILIRSCKSINIGAIGKGNVISGFTYNIGVNVHLTGGQIQYYSENLTIKSSLVGIEADGITVPRASDLEQNLSFIYGNVIIGGTPEEGNVFPKGIIINQTNSSSTSDPLYSTPAILDIRNNKIGVNFNGDVAISQSKGLNIGTSTPNGKNRIFIEDNVISADGYGIRITNNGLPVSIKRNYIGIDRSLTKRLMASTGIFIYYGNEVSIGGQNLADANYIAYCKPVHVWPYSSVSVNKNSFFCTRDAYPMISNDYGVRPFPRVDITSITTNAVIGTATPNSTIEFFYSDLCGTCSPETYFGSTTADANGNWSYSGTILRSVIASATLNGITSEFTRTRIDVTGIRTINTCSNTGSIIGALPVSAQYVQWLDENDNVVGNGANLLNVSPGRYRLKAVSGDCSEITPFYEIRKGLVLLTGGVTKQNPSCGQINGAIRGVFANNYTASPTVYSWKNEGGIEVSTSQNLTNAPAGTYTLTVRTADNSCTEIYGPVTLITTSGPNISISSLIVTPANCGNNNGTITGVTASGSGIITYKWKNESNIQVGTSIDLINQPPGKYTLEVIDQSNCGVVATSPITILEGNAIIINDTQKQIFNPTCVGNNGSIKNLQITGATSYVWRNSNGQIVGAQPNLEGMPPGSYQLTASNAFCTKTYDVNLSAQSNLISHTGVTKTLTDASCGLNNGKIVVTLQGVVRSPKHYRWQDQAGRTVGGNTATLENIDAGTYSVYGIDDNDCEIYLATYSINRQPTFTLRTNNSRVTHDNCNQRQGSITGLQINGGLAPFTYKWTNEAGVQVGNSLDIANLPKGVYKLQVTDALNCSPIITSFTVNNQNRHVAAPTVTPIQLCAPSEATLRINGTAAVTDYVLYASETAMVPMGVSTNGVFKIDASTDKKYFVTQRIGNCESEKVAVKITVGLSGLNIANTITPNNDGINDVWNLSGIENYPKAQIQIFNRTGNKVYESFGYPVPFDGTNKGVSLPVGVYYYMIKLSSECELVTGNLTLIR